MRYTYAQCPCGHIKGIEKDGYRLFKAIYYATAGRWEAPEEVTAWEDTYDATWPGVWCLQRKAFISKPTATEKFYANENVEKQAILYSEKCQLLNIWTPLVVENAPVLVYIHGGGYETGGSTAQTFSGASYCREEGVIVVTVNYRLNCFASAIGDGLTGNYGLQDQICALSWIQKNIRSFGGNPKRITIMGESAGAMSVQNLIYSPMAKGLFQGAIMLSGGGILPRAFRIKGPEAALELWEQVKARLGVASMEELKAVSPEKLYCTWRSVYTSDSRFGQPSTPVIDGITIPDAPGRLVAKGQINAVPTIISVLSEDMWPHTLYTTALDWGKRMAEGNQPPVYGMYMDRAIPESEYGMYHGGDIRYVFGSLDTCWRPFTPVDYRISRDIIAAFAEFARTGVPSVSKAEPWLPIGNDNQKFMHFGDEDCAMVDVPEVRLLETEGKKKPFPGM